MRSPSGSKEICNGSARERHRSQMCIGCGLNRIGGSNRTGGACMKTDGMVKSCLEIYSACNGAASLQLQAKIYSGSAVPMGFLTLPERRRRKNHERNMERPRPGRVCKTQSIYRIYKYED